MAGSPEASAYPMPAGTRSAVRTIPATTSRGSQDRWYVRSVWTPGSHLPSPIDGSTAPGPASTPPPARGFPVPAKEQVNTAGGPCRHHGHAPPEAGARGEADQEPARIVLVAVGGPLGLPSSRGGHLPEAPAPWSPQGPSPTGWSPRRAARPGAPAGRRWTAS